MTAWFWIGVAVLVWFSPIVIVLAPLYRASRQPPQGESGRRVPMTPHGPPALSLIRDEPRELLDLTREREVRFGLTDLAAAPGDDTPSAA